MSSSVFLYSIIEINTSYFHQSIFLATKVRHCQFAIIAKKNNNFDISYKTSQSS